MFDLDKLTPDGIVNGYYFDADSNAFLCPLCGACFELGEIYEISGRFFTAERAVRLHVETAHPNRLDMLLDTDSKYLSLTENQKDLLRLFSAGFLDSQAAKQLGVSPSTVRHQRFMFREKAKSAKMYLAIWEMVLAEAGKNKNSESQRQQLLPAHGGATMIDDRFVITQEENDKISASVFESIEPLKLKVLPPKQKKKIVILRKIAAQFEPHRQYTEKEVNSILAGIFDDYVTLRRYLIEYGYMDRTRDCSAYWLR